VTLAARQHTYSLDVLEGMLLRRIETLARELAADGERRGQEWVARNPNRADNKLGSFSINLTTGKWSDFAADDRSSRTWPCLSLVAYLATAGRWKSDGAARPGAIRWARDWLGLTDRHASPAERQKLTELAEKAARARAHEERTRTEKKRLAAHRIWLEAKPLDGRDPASLYLLARGIDVTKLPDGIPGCLRWTMTCRRYTGDNEFTEHPAMLAAMHKEGTPNGFAACHRTFLAQEESGRWWKAFGGESKTILGPKSGASIRLCKGPSRKPLSQAIEGEWIGIAEGIENALSAALIVHNEMLAGDAIAAPGLRILAAATLENIGKILLPPQIGGVWLIADNDRLGSAASLALEKAADQLMDRDIDVRITCAPQGFKDWNAALMGERCAD
jgi:hypothetical protein